MTDDAVIVYTSTCEGCGRIFERARGRNKRWCRECAQQRVFNGGEQARQRHGPQWELTVRRQVEFWTGEARRLGIDT